MNDLAQLIDNYGFNKGELDSYKKICDKLNTEIKQRMQSEELSDFEGDDYIAKCSIKTATTFNEDALLAVIKASGREDLIKTKEYVDTDALESALYHGEISAETIQQIRKCQTVKQTPVLTIKARKK